MLKEFENCLKLRRLIAYNIDLGLITKELKESELDLENAENSLKEKRYKWATVQAYYCMFHASKALVLKAGYREKSHDCLLIALKELYESKGLIDKELIDLFETVMNAREDADYGLIYSEDIALEAVSAAKNFLNNAKKLLK